MAFPVGAAILGGASLLGGLFGGGGKKKYIPNNPFIGLGDYDTALARGTPGAFNPTFSENDPELMLLRSRAKALSGETRANTTNELARAGLLGTSAGYHMINKADTDYARGLEDIDAGVMARRRMEQLGLFQDQANFARQLEMQRLGGLQSMESQRLAALYGAGASDVESQRNALYGIGNLGGSMLYDWAKKKGWL